MSKDLYTLLEYLLNHTPEPDQNTVDYLEYLKARSALDALREGA